ncbi:DUF2393 domain-containing protein [candidate division KSB1 bacterium]|nr:DUF2393 domain-containing protein [candidate division KSB1 bacterium]
MTYAKMELKMQPGKLIVLILFTAALCFCFCAKEEKEPQKQEQRQPIGEPEPVKQPEQQPGVETEQQQSAPSRHSDYISGYLKIENLVIEKKYKNSFSDFQYAAAGKIVNSGDRTIAKVQLRVLFLNNSDQVIGKARYTPVPQQTVTESQNNHLHPGRSVTFGYFIEEDAPQAWQGRARVEIAAIRFASS